MSNNSVGHEAEVQAAEYLRKHGFKIIELNWKTMYCEIDIIARKDQVVHFVEVKYRHNSEQGTGLDYITSKKLKQMSFAAEMWVSSERWDGEYILSAIEMTQPDFTVTNFIELV